MSSRRQELLRERYVTATANNLVFTVLMAIVLVPVFWNHASRTGLLVWAGLLIFIAPAAYLVRRLELEFSVWYRLEVLVQLVAGVAWGVVAVIGMPRSEAYQSLLLAVLVAVMIASSANESQYVGLYMCFVVPYATLVLSGYLFYPGGTLVGGVLFLVAVVFAVVSAAEDRKRLHRLADLVEENEGLLRVLGDERDALAVANARLDEYAWTDSLTGLANRAAMSEAISAHMESSDALPMIIAYLDLNGFKEVNDTHGHRFGDELLVEVARRLVAAGEDGETVYRLGGDELIVLAASTGPADLGERLASVFEPSFVIEQIPLTLSCSIGLAAIGEPLGEVEILRRADEALYRHKRDQGDLRYVVWTEPGAESDLVAA